MPARRLPATNMRVRRTNRRDLPGVRALLGAPDDRRERFDRRSLADLGNDVYVAEDAGGTIVGLVAVAYARSLRRGRMGALLDAARAIVEPPAHLLDDLVGFAEERARRRGCRELAAWIDPGDRALEAVLVARGWRSGALLVTDLEGPA